MTAALQEPGTTEQTIINPGVQGAPTGPTASSTSQADLLLGAVLDEEEGRIAEGYGDEPGQETQNEGQHEGQQRPRRKGKRIWPIVDPKDINSVRRFMPKAFRRAHYICAADKLGLEIIEVPAIDRKTGDAFLYSGNALNVYGDGWTHVARRADNDQMFYLPVPQLWATLEWEDALDGDGEPVRIENGVIPRVPLDVVHISVAYRTSVELDAKARMASGISEKSAYEQAREVMNDWNKWAFEPLCVSEVRRRAWHQGQIRQAADAQAEAQYVGRKVEGLIDRLSKGKPFGRQGGRRAA
jgi:hypothetical protein